MRYVYLAGPITGLSYSEANSWREEFAKLLPEDITARSPLRGKAFLGLQDKKKTKSTIVSDKGITMRDKYDCCNSDAVVFNFLGASTISIGTCIEVGWASACNKPMVLIMEKPTKEIENVHEHIIIREVCGYHVTTVEEAADLISIMLSDSYSKIRV